MVVVVFAVMVDECRSVVVVMGMVLVPIAVVVVVGVVLDDYF